MWIRIAALFLMAAMSPPADAATQGCSGWRRTTLPAPQLWPGSLDSHRAQIAELPNKTDVLQLGDSHAAIWPAELWQPLQIFSAGNPGDWIENLLWRLQAPEWHKLTPRNVVVAIGTNNLARGDCAFAIVEGVTTVLRRIQEIWPNARVIYIGIPMRGPRGSLRPEERAATNATLRQNAGVTFVDPDYILNCGGCFDSAEIAHLSANGYTALTAAIKPLIW
jgi:hypothetical protein